MAAPKHQRISTQLAADISAGKYGPGDRLPSEAQLTRRYGVSRPTVARALRDLVVEGLIERRAGSGSFVRGDAAATTPGERTIGLLVAGLGTTEVFDLVCGELAARARVDGYSVLWGGAGVLRATGTLTPRDAVEVCDGLIRARVAGVVFAPFEHAEDKDEVNRQVLARLVDAGIATVLLDRDVVPFPARTAFDLVGVDNLAAGFLLADHLLALGCTRLAFVARPSSAATVDARIAGIREALARHGVTPASDWIHIARPDDVALVDAIARRGRYDAVICANDLTAAELIGALGGRVRVPRDLRVVGFDDARYATLVRPMLTTVHQPTADIAAVVLRALEERIASPGIAPRSVLLAPRLVVRESCGAYRTRSMRR